MSKPPARDNSNAVGLFPFLAVLLCTMGALLVLLVVLAQRAGQRTVVEAVPPAQPEPKLEVPSVSAASVVESAKLAQELAEIREYQQQLAVLKQQAAERLQEEQKKLSHLEEHTRRLEHELARLSLAAQQLSATEEHQVVDRQQAEQELARLQGLIEETTEQLEHLREESVGKRSYAIVPYKGPNGTFRKPIYIECSREGIVIQPEGIEFQPSDFLARNWPGNPLATVLRASREHINAQAAAAGLPQPPDPYPVLLVRPDGLKQYSLARSAVMAWDADFGYEFVDADWKLEYPELPDPQLARIQEHAKMQARERLVRLVRSAPSRFGGVGEAGLAGGQGMSGAQPNDWGGGDSAGDAVAASTGGQAGSHEQGNEYGNATGDSGGQSGEGTASAGIESGGPYAATESGSVAEDGGGGNLESGQASGAAGAGSTRAESSRYAASSSTPGTGGDGAPAGSSATCSAAPQINSQQGAAGVSWSSLSDSPGKPGKQSIADSHGKNWAVGKAGSGAFPIRRPIQMIVRKDHLSLMPSRHTRSGVDATGTVITLDRPLQQVSDEFVAVLQQRIGEWGLAGNGLYWRPVLELNVGPDAEQTAVEVVHLLKDSGVEVELPETARGGQNYETR